MKSGKHVIRSVRGTALAVVLVLGGAVASVHAQSPTQPAETATTAHAAAAATETRESEAALIGGMQATIEALERRVTELEARLDAEKAEDAPAPPDAIAVMAPAPGAAAPDVPATESVEFPEFFRKTEVTGFVDVYYGFSFNHSPLDNQLRNFDTKPNQFGLNMFEIALEKAPTEDDRIGFRTDLDFGPASELIHASEPGGQGIFRHVEQAYLSYLAPVGNGLQIDAGKFVTPAGAEVIETKDNWNYSRSLLFALAIPYYHFGVRASYPINDKVSVAGYLVNGWNDVVDNNHRKTLGASVTLKPVSRFSLVANYLAGPEQADGDAWRHLFDTTATLTLGPDVALMANYDYGKDRIAGTGVHWQGIAAYARFQMGSKFAVTPRFEWYDDHDGYTTGLTQTLKEFTVTGEHAFGSGLLGRIEYRRDFSDERYFVTFGDRLVHAQSTLTVGLVYSFDSLGK